MTHPHVSEDFHTAFYCGRAAGLDVVYDASPRGQVPLFAAANDGWRLAETRAIHTRYGRATETTDRLRNDGGAYLRLWDDRQAYYHRGLHERLVAGGAGAGGAAGRDLVALRRAAGLSDLPFYCVRSLPRDVAGGEVYDNLPTRHLDYYVPDGPPVLDDEYEAVVERGEAPGAAAPAGAARHPGAAVGRERRTGHRGVGVPARSGCRPAADAVGPSAAVDRLSRRGLGRDLGLLEAPAAAPRRR